MTDLQRKDLFRNEAYINGEWVETDTQYDVFNPADGRVLGPVPDMGPHQVTGAIEAAEKAFPEWARRPAGERARILRRFHDLMQENQEDLALLMTLEQGKPLKESRGEIAYAASFLEWFGEEAKRTYGDVIPSFKEEARILAIKQPVGIAGAITPWNFPSAMITRKAGAALAAGCPVLIKPAEDTPFSALALARLAEEAGVPPGVFNILTASDPEPIAAAMTGDPRLRKLSFTGSTEVGRRLMAQSADQLKRLSLELGGNAPFIVFEDADLDRAVEGAVACKFRNAGQTCVCANRIYVQDGIYDSFAKAFTDKVKDLKVGNGLEDDVDIGPLINEQGLEKVGNLVRDALDRGAEIMTGGKPHKLGGTFYEPTVLKNADPGMELSCNEIFGPVASLYRFRDEHEALRLANDTQYGLAAYFYTRDAARSWRVAEALEYGIVGVNEGLISTAVAPFGGIKQSGFGREGSKYGIEEYLDIKYVLMGGLDN